MKSIKGMTEYQTEVFIKLIIELVKSSETKEDAIAKLENLLESDA